MENIRKSKALSLMLALALIVSSIVPTGFVAFADTQTVFLEDFSKSSLTGTYADGSFVGNHDVTWQYTHSRDQENFPIDGKGLMLRRGSDGSLTSSTISGGITDFSLDMKKAYTGNATRQLKLLINGNEVAQSQIFGNTTEDTGVHSFVVKNINIEGDVVIEIRYVETTTTNRQITIDNLRWSAYGHSLPDEGGDTGGDEGGDEGGDTGGDEGDLPNITSLSHIRNILNGLGQDGKSTETFTVQGTIIGITGNGQNVYIQDATGNVLVRTASATSGLTVGKTIQATGSPQNYRHLGQFFVGDVSTLKVLDLPEQLIEPELITLSDINESREATLIKVKALEVVSVSTGSSYNVVVKDAQGTTITVRVENTIPAAHFTVGKIYDFTGMVGQFSTSGANVGYQIMPRFAADAVEVTIDDTEAPVIDHEPVLENNIARDLRIAARVTDNRKVSAVTLKHRQVGAETFESIPMVVLEGQYTAIVPKNALSLAGHEYFIVATDDINEARHPLGEAFHSVSIVETDITGPSITRVIPSENQVIPDDGGMVGYRVEYADPSGIDLEAIKLYVNDVDVTSGATVTDHAISYTPDGPHAKGDYRLRVFVKDTLGNVTEKTWTFTVGERSFNFYFGQLHSHTTLSDGQGTVQEAYAWARDQGKADFFAVTDHSNWFDNDRDWAKSTRWQTLKDTANAFNDDGNFVAISGYEMTWSGSTGGWGHINTFNTEWFESRSNAQMDLKNYYERIAQDRTSISQLNHPGKTFGDFADFGFYTKAADDVVHLIEVANGEGPVRGSGYFPSYEYYTRALDKGWHVAPSNNQDNHRGNWVSANTARTVVLSETLDRESIFEAIRALRVYSTEDSNLEISYTVNGQMMGSTLESPERLAFDISINDPDANDIIKKVSIISDGGTVVKSQTFDSNVVNWTFELPSQYTYYYVRVDQADKDIAVTAPVWAGNVVMVGLSDLSIAQDPMILGTENTLTATVYNNGALPLTGATVEFFVGAIAPENKIGESTVSTVMPSSVAKASIAWTATAVGEQKLFARMVTTVDGELRTFTVDNTVLVGREGELPVIMIDAAHFNAYVSGVYPGKIETLRQVTKDNRYMLIENKETITDAVLEKVNILMLADPASRARDHYVPKVYTDEEVAAITRYVEAGGHVIITSGADYGDATGELGNAEQSNKVLRSIGSNLRFNDDQVIDRTKNGGQIFRLYFDQYESPLYGLTQSIAPSNTFSFYSGNSVLLKEGGDQSAIDWLVKGHSTTESDDADKQGDNTPVAKGDVRVLAAEELSGGGKVVVGGTTFYSDFETANSDNAYSNLELTMNILKWMIGTQEAPVKTIAEVRTDADGDGVPDYLGQRFTVEGRITAQSEAVTPKNAFFEVIYVQDETGGITVFGVSQTLLPLGTKVRITGTVGQYENDSQLALSNELVDVVVLDVPLEIPAPKLMSTGDSMLEVNEGWLVQVEGIVTRIDQDGDNAIYINDGSGEARIYLNGYIGDGSGNLETVGKWDPEIKVGSKVRAIGLSAEDMVGPRIRVRNTNDIILLTEETRMSASIRADKAEWIYEDSDELEIYVLLNAVTLLEGVDFDVTFDSEILKFKRVTPMQGSFVIQRVNEYTGKIRFAGVYDEAIVSASDLVLVKITFERLNDLSAETVVALTHLNAVDDDRFESVELKDATLNLTLTKYSDLVDVNKDGLVNLKDVTDAKRHHRKTKDDTNWDLIKHFDINRDGTIDIIDLNIIFDEVMKVDRP